VLGIVESPAFQMNMKNAAAGERRAAPLTDFRE
jgi:hypothetical protein